MAHTSEKLDYTVNAFIVSGKKVLLIYNSQYKIWVPPGGHIEKDEDLEDALYREIEEETGFKKSNLEIIDTRESIPNEDIFSDTVGRSIVTPTFTDVHITILSHKHVAFRYFFKVKRSTKLSSEDECVIKYKWFSIKELKDKKYNLKKHVVYYSIYALKIVQSN